MEDIQLNQKLGMGTLVHMAREHGFEKNTAEEDFDVPYVEPASQRSPLALLSASELAGRKMQSCRSLNWDQAAY